MKIPGLSSVVIVLLLGAPLACGGGDKRQDPPPAPAAAPAGITEESVMTHVRFLTDPALAGRKMGTPGEEQAAAYVEKHLKSAGFEAVGDTMIVPATSPRGTGTRNVVARRRGAGDRVVLVGAHLDHLGVRDGALHPGADDNASGVAVMLEVCRVLAARPLGKTLVCVAFGGEEAGLVGSRAFVASGLIPPDRIHRMINLDMVGRPLFESLFGAAKPDGLGLVVDRIPEAELDAIFALATEERVELMSLPEAWIQKAQPGFAYDSIPFNEAGVATLFFSSSLHADYHRPTDTADRLAPRQLRNRAAAIARIVELLAK